MIRMRRGAIAVVLVALMLTGVVTPAVGAKLAGESVPPRRVEFKRAADDR